MDKITITATVPEPLIDAVEQREEEWSDAEGAADWEKRMEPAREQECVAALDRAYAQIGREVFRQYSASLLAQKEVA